MNREWYSAGQSHRPDPQQRKQGAKDPVREGLVALAQEPGLNRQQPRGHEHT